MKRYFQKPNGDVVLDLTSSSINPDAQVRERSMKMVAEDNAMRPDLFAKSVLGDDSMYDVLLKYNGISNPFSLNTGDLLIIPDPVEVMTILKMADPDTNVDETAPQIKQFTFIDPKTKRDNKRLEMLLKKSQNKELLPPHVNQPGDTNIKYKNGKIIFGEDVTTVSKNNCPETFTRARIKEKLLNSKIFQ